MKIYSLLMRDIESFLVNKQQIINFMLVNDKERSLKGRQTKTRAEDTKQTDAADCKLQPSFKQQVAVRGQFVFQFVIFFSLTFHFSRRSVCEERGGSVRLALPDPSSRLLPANVCLRLLI